MDYSKMLDYHKEKGAECTIAVLDVPLKEASRFGIMNLNEDGSIYEFEEKPQNPKSTMASMGIYIFNWQLLKEYLIEDEKNPDSANDFGKNIIPEMLKDNKKLYAYLFDGYWKDVGTIESLWEANMDLLDPDIPVELKDPDFRIYARNYAKPSSYILPDATVQNSFVAEGCVIKGKTVNSIISVGCKIEEGAVVENSVIMPNTVVKKGAKINYSIVGEDCVIGENASVGTDDKKISVIGHGKEVPDGMAVSGQEVEL
jgi:glucose-1-phosphate adenylyltransferase